jgi:GNAT superfamily N-acetyltransferase
MVIVETESLTEAADKLFVSRGLRQFFAEDVMRIDPSGTAAPAWPAGAIRTEWSVASAGRFHAAYAASFRDRPGFPDQPAGEWIAENDEDDEFRPRWSVLATLPGLGDVGFVTAAVGWIVQVGVVPAARGRGIGAALVRESLSRMAADGATEAWLDVNVNNPGAAALYRRLGFADRGRRARYRR